jgi:hypothetical protein
VNKVREIGIRGNIGGCKSVVGSMEKRSDAKGDKVIGNWGDTLVSVHEQELIDQSNHTEHWYPECVTACRVTGSR